MEVHLFQSFCTFVESKNIIEAANRLGISQPTLSAHLKQLEDMNPQPIFAFQGRRKVLTRFGTDLYKTLKGRFDGLEESVAAVAKHHSDASRIQLKIAGRKEVLCRVAQRIGNTQHPLSFVDCTGPEALHLLLGRKVDVALTNHLTDGLDIVSKPLFRDSFEIIYPANWEVGSSLTAAALRNFTFHPFLAYRKNHPVIDELRSKLKVDQKPTYHRILADWNTLVELVDRGVGWTIAPKSHVLESKRIQSFAISGDLNEEVRFHLLYLKSDSQLGWFRKFVDQLTAIYK